MAQTQAQVTAGTLNTYAVLLGHRADFDPTNHYTRPPHMDEGAFRLRLIEACGLLYPWAVLHSLDQDPASYKDALLEHYSFYMGEMTGGLIDPLTRTYNYPVSITDENAPRQYALARSMLIKTGTVITWMLATLNLFTVRAASRRS